MDKIREAIANELVWYVWTQFGDLAYLEAAFTNKAEAFYYAAELQEDWPGVEITLVCPIDFGK